MSDPIVKASQLLDYSKIRLFTELGGTYVVTATTSVEGDLVTIWTTREDGTSGPTLTCNPDFGICLVEAPDLTLYGRLQNLVNAWQRQLVGTERDDQYVAAAQLVDELEELLAVERATH